VNLLYITVDPSLYTHHSTGEAYPHAMDPFPNNVDGVVPNFTTCTNNNKPAAVNKITHAILLKTCNNGINMNATLIDTLLSLILMAFKLLYKQE
jgi:hypothetical protein